MQWETQNRDCRTNHQRGRETMFLSLKGNQGNLHQDVQQLFTWARQTQFKEIPHQFYQSVDGNHGRIEIRRHWLMGKVEYLEKLPSMARAAVRGASGVRKTPSKPTDDD